MTTQQFTQDEIEYLWGSLEADQEEAAYQDFKEWFYSIVEYTLLNHMERATGAYFRGQFGRGTIDFGSPETAVSGVNSYLTRRVNGRRSRWNGGK